MKEIKGTKTTLTGSEFTSAAAALLDAARRGTFATIVTAAPANPEDTHVKLIRWQFRVGLSGKAIAARMAEFGEDPRVLAAKLSRWGHRVSHQDGTPSPIVAHKKTGAAYVSVPWHDITVLFIERKTGRVVKPWHVPNRIVRKGDRDNAHYCTPKLDSVVEVRAAGKVLTKGGWRRS